MLSESVTKRNNGHPVALRVRNPQPEARTESPNGNLSQENEPTNRIPIRHTGQQPQSENRAESKTSQQQRLNPVAINQASQSSEPIQSHATATKPPNSQPVTISQQQPAYPATSTNHSSTASSPTYTSRLSTGAEEDLVKVELIVISGVSS